MHIRKRYGQKQFPPASRFPRLKKKVETFWLGACEGGDDAIVKINQVEKFKIKTYV